MINTQYTKPILKVKLANISPLNPLQQAQGKESQMKNIANKGDHAIIIDYGSYSIKAGWSNKSSNPQISVRPLINKTKQSKLQMVRAVIGNSHQTVQINKNYMKSAYQRNILVKSGLLQHCHDYIFVKLGHKNPIISPVLITQPLANSIYSRQHLLDQLYRCYKIKSIFIGISPLLGYFHLLNCNMQKYKQNSALIIEIGSRVTHIIPIIKGDPHLYNAKRLNIGATDGQQFFVKSIQIKNPGFKDQLKTLQLTSFYQQHCFMAYDFNLQLEYFLKGKKILEPNKYSNRIVKQNFEFIKKQLPQLRQPIQLQLDIKCKGIVSQQQRQRRQQVRKRMGQRLREAIAKKRKQKQQEKRKHLQQMVAIKQMYQTDPDAAQDQMKVYFGVNSIQTLDKMIRQLKIKLKIQVQPQVKVNYIDTPDADLNSQQLRIKRLQMFHKQAAQARLVKKNLQQQQLQNNLKLKQQNLQIYISNLYQARNQIKKKIDATLKMKADLAKRNSSINQRRMQTLAAFSDQTRKDKQSFGMNQDDLQTFRMINQEDQDINQKLMTIQLQLRECDPQFDAKTNEKGDPWHLFQQDSSPILSADLIKGPQILFQPSIAGCDQMGLLQIIQLIFRNYNVEQRKQLASNIFVLGGGCKIKGLKNRFERQITSLLQPGSNVKVRISEDGINGSYRGLKGLYAKYSEFVEQNSYSRHEYLRNGLKLRKHIFSNIY